MKQTIAYQDNQVLSYAEYGDPGGYPILIQHGLIASIEDGGLFARLVRLGARPICIARPGYGESSPYVMENLAAWGDVVAALVDALRLARFDVLGMSSGAPYSYAIAYRFPERVRDIYIFSGIPALYHERIQSRWPHPVDQRATLAEMQQLARELFFANLSAEDGEKADVRDSMRNDCFGIAQDFKLRVRDWGFSLCDVTAPVTMQHSRLDEAVPFEAAALTARLLPNCRFEIRETGAHFSAEALDDFIRTAMSGHYGG